MPTAERKMNIFYFSIYMLEEKEKQKQEVSAFSNDANTYIDWLIFFIIETGEWTRAWQAVMSNELSQRPIDQNSKKQPL